MGKKALISRAFGLIANYATNPVTVAGAVLTTISAIIILIFVVADSFGALPNPYLGIVGYVIMPGLFVLGLLAIPVGILVRRKRLRASDASAEEIGRYPRLDFNDPHLRRVVTIVLVLTAANAVILGSSSYLALHHMDGVEFCGLTCHIVMQPEYVAYQQSPHSRVDCVKCHIGPGASLFVRSKLDGMKQVWSTTFDRFDRPLKTPLRDLRPARETCEQCHWPAKHYGDKVRVFARFGTDERNTPGYTSMVLKTGGGSLDTGRHGGIHWWHIYSDNRIRYIASDLRRQEIVWVELTTSEGETRTFTRTGSESLSAQEITDQARTLDCIDCHNRPTHHFESPPKAVDELLVNNPDFVELPYFKRFAVAAIDGEYPSNAEGRAAVGEAVLSYYRESHPDLLASRGDLISRAAAGAASVYARTTFPEMNTGWQTHANNIGHDDFPGCWRCHDDEMETSDGKHVIPQDCENCHIFLADDVPDQPDLGQMCAQ
ncbi:MAG: cytochrome C [bacterium]|nr:cytochrome C [bacterium]